MRFEAGAATDTGRVRTLNEDAFACRPEIGLFVVCDGMGGAAAGEVASQLAVETIVSAITESGATASDEDYRAETLAVGAAIERANEVVFAHAQQHSQHHGMGSTAVAVRVVDHVASVAHLGDSRAYLWQSGRFEALTRDHSLADEGVQNVLLRAVGATPEAEVDLAEVPVQAGDYLLLCSDGLTRTVADEAIRDVIETLKEPQRIAERLVADANAAGGPDNVTVVVVQIKKEGFWRR